MEKIKFEVEDGSEIAFYVEEQTRVNGTDYLLLLISTKMRQMPIS